MALRFENAFVVKAPADRVWAYLIDPYRVAPALPGAAITEKLDAETYGGTITMKVGPVSARYKGTIRFESADPAARVAVMSAKGQDVSGRGGADLRMQSRLVERAPDETEVTVVSEVNVTGLLAQLGRGLIQDVSNQMFQRFTEAVRRELEQPEAPAGAAPESPAAPAAAATAAAATAPAAPPPPAQPPRPPQASPPIEVVSFGSQLLARAAGRTMRRPLFWVVAVAIVGFLLWRCSR
jgi:carbon monoxide dehydrogenase subunit G